MTRQYLPTHEWAQHANSEWTMGISAHGADDIGEVVHVALPTIGTVVTAGQPCAEIESVKSIIDIHAPVSGTVSAINDALTDEPQRMNNDPQGDGWMLTISADASAGSALMSEEDYLNRVRSGNNAE